MYLQVSEELRCKPLSIVKPFKKSPPTGKEEDSSPLHPRIGIRLRSAIP